MCMDLYVTVEISSNSFPVSAADHLPAITSHLFCCRCLSQFRGCFPHAALPVPEDMASHRATNCESGPPSGARGKATGGRAAIFAVAEDAEAYQQLKLLLPPGQVISCSLR